jgi:hypothetical protein
MGRCTFPAWRHFWLFSCKNWKPEDSILFILRHLDSSWRNRGRIDFSGNKDLRNLLQLCQDHGLYFFCWLALGFMVKFVMRLSRWLLAKVSKFAQCERILRSLSVLYRIYSQIQDCNSKRVDDHRRTNWKWIRALRRSYGSEGEPICDFNAMAKKSVLLSLFHPTGWAVPLPGFYGYGGYPDAPWDCRLTESNPVEITYLHRTERSQHRIDLYRLWINIDSAEFPYLTAELGGGLKLLITGGGRNGGR